MVKSKKIPRLEPSGVCVVSQEFGGGQERRCVSKEQRRNSDTAAVNKKTEKCVNALSHERIFKLDLERQR